jgi:putative ABC transport system permease protein
MLFDIRYALRTLARNPGFAAVAILMLPLGIGANTAILTVFKGILLRPLPYPEPGRLVAVYDSYLTNTNGRRPPTSK